MDDVEAFLESLYILYAKLAALKAIQGPELLLPGRTKSYRETLQDAYTTYHTIETIVDALGQALEDEHVRLDRAVEQYGYEYEESAEE